MTLTRDCFVKQLFQMMLLYFHFHVCVFSCRLMLADLLVYEHFSYAPGTKPLFLVDYGPEQ